MSYKDSNLTDEQRMTRINRDIKEREGQRRQLIVGCLQEESPNLDLEQIDKIIRISNEWALNDREIRDVFLSCDPLGEHLPIADRLASAMRIDTALRTALGNDQVKCVRWLRRASTHLDGLRPIDCLKEPAYNTSKILNALGQ